MLETFKAKEYNTLMTKMENYMTVSEFAKTIGITPQAVHQAMREKRVSDFMRVGPIYLIHRDEIERYRRVRD